MIEFVPEPMAMADRSLTGRIVLTQADLPFPALARPMEVLGAVGTRFEVTHVVVAPGTGCAVARSLATMSCFGRDLILASTVAAVCDTVDEAIRLVRHGLVGMSELRRMEQDRMPADMVVQVSGRLAMSLAGMGHGQPRAIRRKGHPLRSRAA